MYSLVTKNESTPASQSELSIFCGHNIKELKVWQIFVLLCYKYTDIHKSWLFCSSCRESTTNTSVNCVVSRNNVNNSQVLPQHTDEILKEISTQEHSEGMVMKSSVVITFYFLQLAFTCTGAHNLSHTHKHTHMQASGTSNTPQHGDSG